MQLSGLTYFDSGLPVVEQKVGEGGEGLSGSHDKENPVGDKGNTAGCMWRSLSQLMDGMGE